MTLYMLIMPLIYENSHKQTALFDDIYMLAGAIKLFAD